MNADEASKLSVFDGKQIRKVFHEDEWWFLIIDVVEVLVGGDRPRKYWNDLKKKLTAKGYIEVSEKIGQLKMAAPDGKLRLTDCANTETLFRIIQSIPSPKVEPLKRWLAKVGKERLDEIENPELAMGRMQDLYEKKGYPKEWIDKRLRGIAVRQDLTDEWKDRGAASGKEFAILTNEIMHAAFDLKVVRQLDEDGNEYWFARDLAPLLDYRKGGHVFCAHAVSNQRGHKSVPTLRPQCRRYRWTRRPRKIACRAPWRFRQLQPRCG